MTFVPRAFKNIAALTIATLLVTLTSDVPENLRPSFMKLGFSSVFRSRDIDIDRVIEPLKRRQQQQPHSMKVVRHTVASGDTLSRIWASYGGSNDEALEASRVLADFGPQAKTLRKGEQLALLVSNDGEIRGLRKKLLDGGTVVLRSEGDAGYSSRLVEPKFQEAERTVSGVIYSSFSKAASTVDLPYEVVDELVDLFSDRIDFRKDMQVGDTFTVIYSDRRTHRGQFVELGEIKAASITNNGKMLVAIRHKNEQGVAHFYDDSGAILGDHFLRYPVQFTRISSVFAKNRFHPVSGVNRPHNGVDFAAPIGTPVRSIAGGVITEVGYKNCTGNMVRIQHDKKYTSEYFHLNSIAPNLKRGSRVGRGELIGAVGKTGLATGPHLHFGFFENGKYVDPLNVELPTAPSQQERIPPQYLMATLTMLRSQQDAVRVAQVKTVASDPKA